MQEEQDDENREDRADERGVFLGDDVMDFMLTRFSRDLGSLMELLELLDPPPAGSTQV